MKDVWTIDETDAARWIFPERPNDAINQYVDFLHVFECDQPVPEVALHISAAADLRVAVADRFWDPTEDAFRTHEHAPTLTELTQALAILAGVGDDNIRGRALDRMGRSDSGLAGPGLSQSFYTFAALMTRKDKFGAKVLTEIEETWGRMLDAGATTFWETVKGASDFSNAGSLCHGWSVVPVYVLYHDILGVQPCEPGFKTFVVEPLSEVVGECSGRIPTPAGDIVVNLGKANCTVTAPDGLVNENPGRKRT